MEDNLKDQESMESKKNNASKEGKDKDTVVSNQEEKEGEIPVEEGTGQQTEVGNLQEAMKALAELRLQLRETQKEAAEHKSQALRLQADFINFRKRKEKEMADMIRFANEDLVKELLPVLDNFDRTLDAIDKTDNLAAVKEGIGLVSNSMRRQLNKIGLEPIESRGKSFDVNLHDAITSMPVEEDDKKGVVLDEVEKGYKLKDKVIRFSKVVVGE